MSERINLQDLAALLAEKMTITKKDAETFLREYFEVLNEELVNSGSVKIKDLGTFKLLPVEDRESVDVTTGARVLIPAHYKVAFTSDKKLAETVNEPFAFFETTEIDGESAPEELQLLPEEDASEEPELSADEEEDAVFEKEPEEKEEKKEEKPISTRETRAYCLNCHDYEAHHVYRKKYFNARKKLNMQRVIILILSLLLAAALGYIVFMTMYNKNVLAPIFHKITTNFTPAQKVAPADSVALTVTPADSIVPADSVTSTGNIAPTEKPAKTDIVEKPVPPASSSIGSKRITISTGDRLATIAQKEYGNKVFWIYIYLENKAIIHNPDVLPLGGKIVIPPAAKYEIDSNNPASIQKAKDVAARHP